MVQPCRCDNAHVAVRLRLWSRLWCLARSSNTASFFVDSPPCDPDSVKFSIQDGDAQADARLSLLTIFFRTLGKQAGSTAPDSTSPTHRDLCDCST